MAFESDPTPNQDRDRDQDQNQNRGRRPDARPLTFGERLILAEEHRRAPREASPPHRADVLVIERTDFTTTSAFHIQEPGRELPVEGPGTVVNMAVIADSDQFDVFLAIDGETTLSDPFTTLQTRSSELERIGAYERDDGDYVWTASDYDFQDAVDVVITPQESITFRLQRAELELDTA